MINLEKHGIDFADVWEIFDYDVVTDIDDRFDYCEVRYFSFGLLRGEIIAIAHTESDNIF